MHDPNDDLFDDEYIPPKRDTWVIHQFRKDLKQRFKKHAKKRKVPMYVLLERILEKEMNRKTLRKRKK